MKARVRRVAKLVALAAKQALDEYPSAIGVRLSPISLSASDVERIPEEIRALLGPKVYVAASAPKVRRRVRDRVVRLGLDQLDAAETREDALELRPSPLRFEVA